MSLRSFHDTVDVSEIAKRFSGGGHKKAAGFTLPGDAQVDDLFDLEEEGEEEDPVNEAVEEIKEEIEELIKKAEKAGVDVVIDTEEKKVSIHDAVSGSNSAEKYET